MAEFEFLMSMGDELGQYAGRWVAVVGEEIVAVGDSGVEVFEKAKEKYPDREPLIMKVVSETVILL